MCKALRREPHRRRTRERTEAWMKRQNSNRCQRDAEFVNVVLSHPCEPLRFASMPSVLRHEFACACRCPKNPFGGFFLPTAWLVSEPAQLARTETYSEIQSFSPPVSWIERAGVTPGSARTWQGAALHLPKGMIPFGNLCCLRRAGLRALHCAKGLVPWNPFCCRAFGLGVIAPCSVFL